MNPKMNSMNGWQRIANSSMVCVIALAAVTACATDSTGLDPSQLESQLSSLPSSTWTEISTPDSTSNSLASPDDVRRAFEELVTRRVQCGRDPTTCDITRIAVTGSTIEKQLDELMAKRVADGITASERGRATYRIDSVDVEAADRALVTTCLHDDTVLVIDSAVFDDSVYSARSVWTLVEVGGEWLWSEEQILEWVMEGNLCDEL